MEIYRIQPYQDVNLEYTIPENTGTGSLTVEYQLTDMADLSVVTGEATVENEETYSVAVSGLYDSIYRLEVIHNGEHIWDETYEVVRRYIDPASVMPDGGSIAEYEIHEEIARAIVDSVIPEGFYYKKKTIETVGLGADYIPLWLDAKKILKVYENNVLVYDASDPSSYPANYEITKDKTAVTIKYDGAINKDQGAPNIIPGSYSDLVDTKFSYRGFVREFDYRLILEVGYSKVPQDIIRAMTLLIDDIACGKVDYYKRYISDYGTDQFKLKFSDRVFEGTGNLIVDKILSKYSKSIRTVGVL
jgi:hypothetical protein